MSLFFLSASLPCLFRVLWETKTCLGRWDKTTKSCRWDLRETGNEYRIRWLRGFAFVTTESSWITCKVPACSPVLISLPHAHSSKPDKPDSLFPFAPYAIFLCTIVRTGSCCLKNLPGMLWRGSPKLDFVWHSLLTHPDNHQKPSSGFLLLPS